MRQGEQLISCSYNSILGNMKIATLQSLHTGERLLKIYLAWELHTSIAFAATECSKYLL
jgi:hypothetical protein